MFRRVRYRFGGWSYEKKERAKRLTVALSIPNPDGNRDKVAVVIGDG